MLIQKGFCIVNANGEMHFGESCICTDPKNLQPEADALNEDDPAQRWQVVPFFARVQYQRMEPTYLNQHPLLMQAHELRVATDKLPAHTEQTDLMNILGDWYDQLEEHLHKHQLLAKR